MAEIRAAAQSTSRPHLSTAPVLAVLVCRRDVDRLPDVLSALEQLTVRPRHLLAVVPETDGESRAWLESSADSAARSVPVDGVLTVGEGTGFGAAVGRALEHARERWGDPGGWLWPLYDDSIPEPECLETLLRVAETDSAAAMLGPLGLDSRDPRLLVEAGLSMDTSGRVHTGVGQFGLDPALGAGAEDAGAALQVSEVLAVSAAAALVRREVFEELDGFDEFLSEPCADVDLGWRINAAGHLVLCVPRARTRRAAGPPARGRLPPATTAGGTSGSTVNRADELRTYLANIGPRSGVLAVPRLLLLGGLRLLGYAATRRFAEARAEAAAAWMLLTGRLGIRSAGRTHGRNPVNRSFRGLLIGRITRIRMACLAGYARIVRNRVRHDTLLGLPTREEPAPVARGSGATPRYGPDALPAGALGTVGTRRRSAAGLRRPDEPVVVAVPEDAERESRDPRPRPSPGPRGGTDSGESGQLVLVPVNRGRVFRELLLNPPILLVVGLALFALAAHGLLADGPRIGLSLHGGRLLPVADLETTWSSYLAAWHPVHGGTAAQAPPALLVLGLLGAVLAPLGGPPAALALLVLLQLPLAGAAAYHACDGLAVSRTARALAAAAYALLPVGMLAAAEGRPGVVVAHVLLPPLLVGAMSLVGTIPARTPARPNWLGTACRTALGAAVLAAFAPGMYVLLLVLAAVGFCCPASVRTSLFRRTAGFASLVLLPVACLLPWPAVLFREPEILVHGLGAPVVETPAGISLLSLNAVNTVAGWSGVLVVCAAVIAVLRTRDRAVLGGLLVAFVGWGASLLVGRIPSAPAWGGPETVGWPGGPLLLVACGLLWTTLAAVAVDRAGRPPASSVRRLLTVATVASVGLLATGSAFAAQSGPLRVTAGSAAGGESTGDGYWLRLRPGGLPPELTPDGQSRFGTTALVPAPGATAALTRIEEDLLADGADRVRSGVAAAAARGVGRIAVPGGERARRFGELAGDLVASSGAAPDGGAVFRVLLPNTPVTLLGPAQASNAREGGQPRPQSRPIRVGADLPHVTVRFSRGGPGRVLLLAAQRESGWRARIGGEPVGLATGWGEQVAVPLPENAGEVTIGFTGVPRTTLLSLQAAALLFTLIGAAPGRVRSGRGPG
ncbi:GT2 family glycosyltransferase [Actinopolyspora biskrensis]|uniref:GT2 family glycosyltransferase n=1 Tax=Actinopolyspora biskrensis TaxID=1470178 RepID=A0A852YZ14_9ACTN|nr:GT2 family glycosyltransferase [Actinopolyspora biskrensis]